MSDSSTEGHAVLIIGVAAGIGAVIATGINFFIRKEDKSERDTENSRIKERLYKLEQELETVKDEEKKLKKDLKNVKKAVVQPERIAQLTTALSEQTHQAQEMLSSQVLEPQEEQEPPTVEEDSSETF